MKNKKHMFIRATLKETLNDCIKVIDELDEEDIRIQGEKAMGYLGEYYGWSMSGITYEEAILIYLLLS